MAFSRVPGVFPVLRADGLLLREPAAVDIELWYQRLIDPQVYELTSDDPASSVDEVRQGLELLRRAFLDREQLCWAIVPDGLTEAVGSCGFNHFSERDFRGEIGYSMNREWWGQGIMTRAAGAVVSYGFDVLGLERIEATVMAGNERSARVLEKLGFQREGLLRSYKVARGVRRDFWMYGLTRQ